MKTTMIALSMLAVLAVSACSNTHNGTWTPMSAGRTAGEGTVDTYKPVKKADKTFSHSLRK
jgi:hypothetical protein